MTLVKWKKPSENGQTSSPVIFNSPFSGLIENFFGDDLFTKEYASFVPAVNVTEEETKFNLDLSAPGFNKEDFKIELEEGSLIISGEHKTEKETKDKTFNRKEFNYGSFQRSFTLPDDVNTELIDAKYENGILKISLPKKEKEKRKSSKEIRVS